MTEWAIVSTLTTAAGSARYVDLDKLAAETGADVARLPHTVKILLENIARRVGGRDVSRADVESLAHWPHGGEASLAFMPARVLMQDFTGVPAVVDLAALRSALARAGGDPQRVNPFVPVDLIIDHSVQVDRFGSADAYTANLDWEYRRNRERYALLNWAQQAFRDFRVVPPGMGICHQVNLEHLGRVVVERDGWVFPDTVVGTDSHTPMINGLGVLGWGVGGIEAEAAMLGQPMFLPKPFVVGVRTRGQLPPGTTATDLVLTLTQMLREHGVVGKFVEFFGPGLSGLSIADRATLANMSPEGGATATLFPVDANTLAYLRLTGRGAVVDVVERYTREQGLFRTDTDAEPEFNEVLDLDLSSVEPSLAGPKRPQDRVALSGVARSFRAGTDGAAPEVPAKQISRLDDELDSEAGEVLPAPPERLDEPEAAASVTHGSVVIAAITSCTNTSNPSVMVAAGLLAKKAVDAGLQVRPWVKTSLAPGSRVVTDYLARAGLTPYLEALGFDLVGYGCTTCIGNSGPLPEEVAEAVTRRDLTVAAVLSGNRNFEGRIHAQVKASYLASPPLVVAYALTGTVLGDMTTDPLGNDEHGRPIFLKDVWPTAAEVEALVASSVAPEQFAREYGRIFEGDENWKSMPAPTGDMFEWAADSTYVREPPFFLDFAPEPAALTDIDNARVLAVLGDSITTDHISPAGAISADSPAGRHLVDHGVAQAEFNSFGSRRGNHEVMMRGTFGNIRLRNQMVPDVEGPFTRHGPSGERMSIFDAAMRYQQDATPLVVIAGREYGSGSSRDWAAKGAALLGIKAVIARSYERIHRSNLVCMGVLPLQFENGDSAESLGLNG
ncbi:MAG: aconitate hydratase AcnA, partial [Longimicrobiales bacterium]